VNNLRNHRSTAAGDGDGNPADDHRL